MCRLGPQAPPASNLMLAALTCVTTGSSICPAASPVPPLACAQCPKTGAASGRSTAQCGCTRCRSRSLPAATWPSCSAYPGGAPPAKRPCWKHPRPHSRRSAPCTPPPAPGSAWAYACCAQRPAACTRLCMGVRMLCPASPTRRARQLSANRLDALLEHSGSAPARRLGTEPYVIHATFQPFAGSEHRVAKRSRFRCVPVGDGGAGDAVCVLVCDGDRVWRHRQSLACTNPCWKPPRSLPGDPAWVGSRHAR